VIRDWQGLTQARIITTSVGHQPNGALPNELTIRLTPDARHAQLQSLIQQHGPLQFVKIMLGMPKQFTPFAMAGVPAMYPVGLNLLHV